MRWIGRRQSDNIEDRRGQGGGFGGLGGGPRIGMGFPGGRRAGGGLGIGAVVLILAVSWFLGVNPLTLLGGLDGGQPGFGTSEPAGRVGAPSDQGAQFIAFVLADTEDTWDAILAREGRRYAKPTLVLFTGQTQSACGFASAASGPFYCPGDSKVYIDLAFYQELRDKFRAPGDFAQAYVIAHEIGHHVQNLLGILPKVNAARQQASERDSNQLSIRTELQADCFAGMWAREAERKNILEAGDLEEGLTAAAAVGDDTIQKRTRGVVVPESFNHGTAAQRSRWFKRGYSEGRLAACDTFAANEV